MANLGGVSIGATWQDSGRAAVRRLPIGAEAVPGGVHSRVWAPGTRLVEAPASGELLG